MAKHIHVFTASDFTKAKIRTTDSPEWNESQHKRDHGKFSSTGGAKGEAPSKPAAKKTMSKNKAGFNQPSPDPKAKPAPIQHASATGQTFLPRQSMASTAPSGSGKPATPKQPSNAEMAKHPQYTKEDHDYLTGKGWTNAEIKQRWDEERGAGHAPQAVNKYGAQMQAHFAGIAKAMGGPVRAPERTPMRQAMRNQEAAGVKEARRITRTPRLDNINGTGKVLKSVAHQQAEATLAEVSARLASRKK